MGDVDPQTINAMVEDRFPASTLRCIEIGPDFALCHMAVERGLLRPGGYIAGPTQFAAADSALHAAGRRNVVGSVSVWVDDERHPSAVAQGTYALPREAAGAA